MIFKVWQNLIYIPLINKVIRFMQEYFLQSFLYLLRIVIQVISKIE